MGKTTTGRPRLKWVLAEVERLAAEAERHAQEEQDRAVKECESCEISSARSETAAHYARELRRILTGKTFVEAVADAADSKKGGR